MKKICIVYYSISGSTADIAGILGHELAASGFSVETAKASDSIDLGRFDAVIIGSPMHMGNVRPPINAFIHTHADQLSRNKVFFYYSLLYVTRISNMPDFTIPCHVDPSLGLKTIEKKDASGFDRHHSMDYYLKRLYHQFRGVRLAGVAFFNGRLNIQALSLPERIFMNIIIRLTAKEKEGNFLNPEAARAWTRDIASLM
ncbi:MAG: hypothetical protein JXA07_04365 [Spirochaetes bacterium]|nr:hypothetical protein [Spirochaetota bacterium]